MRTVFWRDMLAIGTAVNMLFTIAALIAASRGAATWAVAAIHFGPLPYNFFLFSAVRKAYPKNLIAPWVALAWLVAMTAA